MRPQRILLVFRAFLLIMLFATAVYADTPFVSVFGPVEFSLLRFVHLFHSL
jgi:hypothetical protein